MPGMAEDARLEGRLLTPFDQPYGAYLAEVRAIAPQQISNRDAELRALTDFCVGENAYQWWQGPPWAGKTALAAWFVLHPPPGIRVAWFFVTRRIDGRADSDAFTNSMIDQLALLARLPIPRDIPKLAQNELFTYLLDAAAYRLRQTGERLVLVVDGLDEDTAGHQGRERRSIASLLPYSPPDGVRVLVTSREHPLLPDDMPSRHPLLTCPRVNLNQHAEMQAIAAEAKKEILTVLQDADLGRDILTFITAAGGGLTATELGELTERTALEIENWMHTALGRSLSTRPRFGTTEEIYIFAHETLRETATKILGANLELYRAQFRDWATKYKEIGWPETTPRYLLEPYAAMLTTAKHRKAAASLFIDRLRHDCMLVHTGADTAGIAEVVGIQDLLLEDSALDLNALVLLAAEKDRLASRNQNIPVELPTALFRLGQPVRAVALARNIPEPETRARAIGALAAEMGHDDPGEAAMLAAEAEQAAFDPARASTEEWALSYVVRAFATAGERERAEEIAGEIDVLRYRAQALADVAVSWAAEQPRRAVRLATEAERVARAGAGHDPYAVRGIAEVGAKLAGCYPSRGLRLVREAERVARDASAQGRRAELLAEVAVIVAVSHPGRAERLAREASRIARSLDDWWRRKQAVTQAAVALAATGSIDQAQEIAREITDVDDLGEVLVEIAAAFARTGLGSSAEHTADNITSSQWHKATALARAATELARHDPEHAIRMANKAARIARSDANNLDEDLLFRDMAPALATGGFLDQAFVAVYDIASSSIRASALSMIAATLAADAPELASSVARRAIAAARDITSETSYEMELEIISKEFSAAGLPECARDAIIDIEQPHRRINALTGLAAALAGKSRHEAAEAAREAAAIALSVEKHLSRDFAILHAVQALSAAGLFEEARQISRDITEPATQAEALSEIAVAMVADHLYDEAEMLAHDISDPASAHALAIISAAVSTDNPDWASRIARSAWTKAADLTSSSRHQEALLGTIRALSGAGHWNLAEDLAESFAYSDYFRDRAFSVIAACYARAQRWRRAEEALNRVASPRYKAEALAEFIEFLAGAGGLDAGVINANSKRIRRFIGTLLATPYWKKALAYLGRLDPDSVVGLYEWATSP